MRVEKREHDTLESALVLELTREEAASLAEALEAVYSGERAEFRQALSSGWLLFWKKREGDSRQLLAHPELEVWVATLALEASHGAAVVAALRTFAAGVAGDALEVSRLAPGPISGVSNVEVTIRPAAGMGG